MTTGTTHEVMDLLDKKGLLKEGQMVRVMIQHKTNDVNGLMDLLKSVREEILKFPGYVTSEYLENVEDPTNLLVISTWKNPEHWKAWVNSKVCKQLTDQVEQKLIEPLKINVYNYHLFKSKRVWSI